MIEALERYEIIAEIGQGGFATVYRAWDTQLERLVALKSLKPALLHDTDWVRRFRREARIIARLNHPHIVPIYDIYETVRRLLIAMRLIEGPTLAQRLATQGRLSWTDSLKIITALAAGLGYAHERGLLHRNLKPGNILLDPKQGAMLTDFGMAKRVAEPVGSGLATDISLAPSPYIAPEIRAGKPETYRSDIYALGSILYELVTGQKFFDGDLHHLPVMWPKDLPSSITEVLEKALAYTPDQRYATMGQFVQALDDVRRTT